MNLKLLIGLLLGFGIGFGSFGLGIPAPAPPMLMGALLVVAMSAGWVLADRFFARRAARSRVHCGGPSGTGGTGAST